MIHSHSLSLASSLVCSIRHAAAGQHIFNVGDKVRIRAGHFEKYGVSAVMEDQVFTVIDHREDGRVRIVERLENELEQADEDAKGKQAAGGTQGNLNGGRKLSRKHSLGAIGRETTGAMLTSTINPVL